MEMGKELKAAKLVIDAVSPITNNFSEAGFGATMCMLIDEYCYANNKDIFDMIHDIHENIVAVNYALGVRKK